MAEKLELYAWVGEDEFGSGEVGLKQGIVPAGCIPLVSMQARKLMTEELLTQTQMVVDGSGKSRRLVRFVEVETIAEQKPKYD